MLASLITRAVLIYVPAHEPDTIIVNLLLGIVALTVWTVKYDNATGF